MIVIIAEYPVLVKLLVVNVHKLRLSDYEISTFMDSNSHKPAHCGYRLYLLMGYSHRTGRFFHYSYQALQPGIAHNGASFF